MKLTGKLLIKAGIALIAGGFGYLTYINAKDIRREETINRLDQEEDNRLNDRPLDYLVTPKMETSEVVKKAVTKSLDDIKEAICENPYDILGGMAIGALAGICYIAGTNDGSVLSEEAEMEAFKNGTCLGFSSGRIFMGDHIEKSNPETKDTIMNNLDIYERMHPEEMRFDTEKFFADPRVRDMTHDLLENAQVRKGA